MASGEWHKANDYLKSLIIEDYVSIERWKPCKIPPTKMKVETMRNQLSNSIQFIIDYIVSWTESSRIRTNSKAFLYQKYLEWCGNNVKLCKHGLSDIEEFSDISQVDLPINKTTDIPIFNMPEIIPPKIILSQPKENLPLRDKKAEFQSPQHLRHLKVLRVLNILILVIKKFPPHFQLDNSEKSILENGLSITDDGRRRCN
ncbi:hypothetical protein GLOIN_2v1877063 [Rhizophagus clarus]|uniref:DNA primase/nucleoside triphosphatase C-terminal domain-containing protein n=1 Tax=Rhizophagus clarus TaxID=94130 RepID=A0A8H3M8L1_9GLOM|nr:hypothetical protein GLOIN_2v1877063 [Rhizophagus clarus]